MNVVGFTLYGVVGLTFIGFLGNCFLGAFGLAGSDLMFCSISFLVGAFFILSGAIGENYKEGIVLGALCALAFLGCLTAGIVHTYMYEELFVQSVSYMFANAIGLTSTLAPSEAMAVVDFGIGCGALLLAGVMFVAGCMVDRALDRA